MVHFMHLYQNLQSKQLIQFCFSIEFLDYCRRIFYIRPETKNETTDFLSSHFVSDTDGGLYGQPLAKYRENGRKIAKTIFCQLLGKT